MVSPEVSFIIVNYNTAFLAEQAVASIYKCVTENTFEIILVDNGSSTREVNNVLKTFPEVKLIELNQNLGFGKANNVGFEATVGNFIFLLNSDAYLIEETTIPAFLAYLKDHPETAIVGGNLRTKNGTPNVSYGNFLSVEKMKHDLKLKEQPEDYYHEQLSTAKACDVTAPTAVDYLTAAAIMIKRSVINVHGLFDPRYFMYFEDQDLAFRYKKAGYQSVLLPHQKIVHIGGQSGIHAPRDNKFLQRQVRHSKFLFLKNVTNPLSAYLLYVYSQLRPKLKNMLGRLRSF